MATVENVVSPVFRTTAEITKDLGAAAISGDTKRMRELVNEYQDAQKREAAAESIAKSEELRKALDPIKAQMVRIVERPEVLSFVKEQGGVFSFTYRLPAEGSDQGPEIDIRAGAKAAAPAPRAAKAPGTGSTGGGRGNVYVVGGQRLTLSDAFNVLATEEDKAAKADRQEKAGTDKSRNSAGWAVMSRVVNKAVEAGAASIEQGS